MIFARRAKAGLSPCFPRTNKALQADLEDAHLRFDPAREAYPVRRLQRYALISAVIHAAT